MTKKMVFAKKIRSSILNRGFSLVEMMIVLTIFGLVIAMGTPPLLRYLRHSQSKDSAHMVAGVLRNARAQAIHDKNDYVVFFDTQNSQMTILDDNGGGGGIPGSAGFNPANRNNGRPDSGERVMGPYQLPDGQVFGFIGGTVNPDGDYVTAPVTFSGSPPRVIFHADGTTNEEGFVFVMPDIEFRQQEKGTDKMMIVRRSTGSVIIRNPDYN